MGLKVQRTALYCFLQLHVNLQSSQNKKFDLEHVQAATKDNKDRMALSAFKYLSSSIRALLRETALNGVPETNSVRICTSMSMRNIGS